MVTPPARATPFLPRRTSVTVRAMVAGTPPVPTFPAELRPGLARREPVALARFFDVFFERVYAYLRRFLADEHQAEDLTQEVFLQVQRSLASYDETRDPRAWLFTIATNKLRDFWRARAAETGVLEASWDQEEPLPTPALRAPPADAELEGAELAEHVRAAIEALPAGLRAAVVLRVYEELSFEEIGRILGRNEVAVRKRFSRGLAALREALGPLGQERTGSR
jgi:RNA polymerase sigma-70 factor (ECF subfamily)